MDHEPKQGMNAEKMAYWGGYIEKLAEITDEQIEEFVERTKPTRKTQPFDYVQAIYEGAKNGSSEYYDILRKFILFSTLDAGELQRLDKFCRANGYLPGLHSMPTDIQNYKRTFYINYEDEG